MAIHVHEIEKAIDALRKRLSSSLTSRETAMHTSQPLPVVEKDIPTDKTDRNSD